MSQATLKTKVKSLTHACTPSGFAQDGPYWLKRSRPFVDQMIEIQPGRDWLAGRFTCNLCWKHLADGIPAIDTYSYTLNLGQLIGSSELWLSHDTKVALDADFNQVTTLLNDNGIPFLDHVADLNQMVEMYEEAERSSSPIQAPTDARLFFGVDEGWKHYNLEFAYKALGQHENARRHFYLLIDTYSDVPLDWVHDRRQRCVEALASL